jgi:hypothetical protein
MNLSLHSNSRYKITVSILLLCLNVWLVSCSTFIPLQYSGRCLPDFPYKDEWYGGDGAYSIPLDGQRTLWVFGDTFVSEEADRKDRIGMDVILGTTLAVSTCSADHQFSIQYFLKKENGKFVSSFGRNEWLWPQDPFIAHDILYIPLLIIQLLPETQPPFNFKVAGHKIARIKDFTANDPHAWLVEYLDWTDTLPEGVEALATTSVVHHDYVYFYPLYRYVKDNVNIYGNILARISVDHLDNPANHFEYWTREGAWRKKLQPGEVKIIFSAGLSELSVRYHAQDRQWMAVYLSPINKGQQLLYSTAQSPEGPWSPSAVLIEAIAEVDPHSPLYDQHTFCYAGKEHHQFAYNRDIVVTYVCNSYEDISNQSSYLRKNLFLYRPAVKTIQR